MMDTFQRLRLIWVILLGLLCTTTGSFAAVGGYDAAECEFIAAKGTSGVHDLIGAGSALDRGGRTMAGRALEKHGSRSGSVFPQATGNVAALASITLRLPQMTSQGNSRRPRKKVPD